MPHVCSSDRALRMQPEAAVDDRAQAPKERPILFSGPMVRALLDGSKTQTRRPVKGIALEWLRPEGFTPEFVADPANHLCPYGAPGERLWVRETWQHHDWTEDGEPIIGYAAGGTWLPLAAPDLTDRWADLSEPSNFAIHGRACDQRWRPSIHMPRWASRITLEITDVRVERLQDISEEDAEAEGVDEWARRACGDPDALWPSDKFELLWCGINGRDSWQANPWVWVLSFRQTASGSHRSAGSDEQNQGGAQGKGES